MFVFEMLKDFFLSEGVVAILAVHFFLVALVLMLFEGEKKGRFLAVFAFDGLVVDYVLKRRGSNLEVFGSAVWTFWGFLGSVLS
jgi:hypothetical protein